VGYDHGWDRLVDYIDDWASAREVPGGIEITLARSSGATRTIEVVMTPDEWDDYTSTIYGTDDPGRTTLKEIVLAMPEGAPYLVYDSYDWTPSGTRDLREDDLSPGPGAWIVQDDRGAVIDRFADFDDRG
jgi:hypothetical protein